MDEIDRLRREVGRLQRNIERRDKYLVDKDLWPDFTAQLPEPTDEDKIELREELEKIKSLTSKLAALEDENKTLREMPEGTLALSGTDITISYGSRTEAEKAFDILESALSNTAQAQRSEPAASPAEEKRENEAIAWAQTNKGVVVQVTTDQHTAEGWVDRGYPHDNVWPLVRATPLAPQPLEGAVKVKELDVWNVLQKTYWKWKVEGDCTEDAMITRLAVVVAESLSPAPQPVGEVSDMMVRKAGDVLLGHVNAPEQVVYAAARLALTAALASASPSPAAKPLVQQVKEDGE